MAVLLILNQIEKKKSDRKKKKKKKKKWIRGSKWRITCINMQHNNYRHVKKNNIKSGKHQSQILIDANSSVNVIDKNSQEKVWNVK